MKTCLSCGEPVEAGSSLHYECALSAMRVKVAARIEGDLAKERSDRDSERRTSAMVGARRERERIIEWLRVQAGDLRVQGSRATEASVLVACAQRAAALVVAADSLEGAMAGASRDDLPLGGRPQ